MKHHDHEIFHLNGFDRRKFLQVGAGLGATSLLGNLVASTPADAATVKLPGFSAFASTVKKKQTHQQYQP
jgi:hypothetical protein